MTRASRRLGLGPLPRNENVKLQISLPAALKETLDRYAAVHSQVHGERVDTPGLIPHMLAAFVERDRGFKAMRSLVTSPRIALKSDAVSGA